ncbi:hypothetical protein C8R46DRAFT_369560 [Mycena filopes]|nr:hypothetical protein C8R46DRAFT_369560 [Mycena filopes]
MSLAEAPQDVLLEVVKSLDLIDLFKFLSVCRALRALQCQKSLWLHALVRLREVEMQPLPLLNAKQLDSMSRQDLQDAARRAVRLKRNLNSDKPTPVEIHALSVESRAFCACLPGSNLVVTHCPGFMSCWDVLTSNRVARLEIVGLDVIDNLRIEEDGRVLFGAVIGTDQFAAIYIDYQDPDQVSVSYVTSPRTAVGLRRGPGFFMNSDVMGICTFASTAYWSMKKNSEVQIGPGIVPDWELFETPSGRCLLVEQQIYILYQTVVGPLGVYIERYSFPPTTPPGQPARRTLSVPYPFAEERLRDATNRLLGSTHLQLPEFGVSAVGHISFEWDNESTTSMIHLWPGQVVSGNIDVGIKGFLHATEGAVELIAVGRSGRYILILVRSGPIFSDPQAAGDDGYLGLVHVELSPTPHTTFRRLEVDGLPPVSSILHLALDDSLGRVLVADFEGGLTVVLRLTKSKSKYLR